MILPLLLQQDRNAGCGNATFESLQEHFNQNPTTHLLLGDLFFPRIGQSSNTLWQADWNCVGMLGLSQTRHFLGNDVEKEVKVLCSRYVDDLTGASLAGVA